MSSAWRRAAPARAGHDRRRHAGFGDSIAITRGAISHGRDPPRAAQPRVGGAPTRLTCATNARISAGSFTPGALSTPEDTSTAGAPVTRSASATFCTVSPPASSHGPGGPVAQDPPVERQRIAAWPGRIRRRLGVQQQRVCPAHFARQVGSGGHPDRATCTPNRARSAAGSTAAPYTCSTSSRTLASTSAIAASVGATNSPTRGSPSDQRAQRRRPRRGDEARRGGGRTRTPIQSAPAAAAASTAASRAAASCRGPCRPRVTLPLSRRACPRRGRRRSPPLPPPPPPDRPRLRDGSADHDPIGAGLHGLPRGHGPGLVIQPGAGWTDARHHQDRARSPRAFLNMGASLRAAHQPVRAGVPLPGGPGAALAGRSRRRRRWRAGRCVEAGQHGHGEQQRRGRRRPRRVRAAAAIIGRRRPHGPSAWPGAAAGRRATAPATVLGMSCSFRSRNTGRPRMPRTPAGPCASTNCKPQLQDAAMRCHRFRPPRRLVRIRGLQGDDPARPLRAAARRQGHGRCRRRSWGCALSACTSASSCPRTVRASARRARLAVTTPGAPRS